MAILDGREEASDGRFVAEMGSAGGQSVYARADIAGAAQAALAFEIERNALGSVDLLTVDAGVVTRSRRVAGGPRREHAGPAGACALNVTGEVADAPGEVGDVPHA